MLRLLWWEYCKLYDYIAVMSKDAEKMTCTLWEKAKATVNKPTEKQTKQKALEENSNE